jgi:hypothetical protein
VRRTAVPSPGQPRLHTPGGNAFSYRAAGERPQQREEHHELTTDGLISSDFDDVPTGYRLVIGSAGPRS